MICTAMLLLVVVCEFRISYLEPGKHNGSSEDENDGYTEHQSVQLCRITILFLSIPAVSEIKITLLYQIIYGSKM